MNIEIEKEKSSTVVCDSNFHSETTVHQYCISEGKKLSARGKAGIKPNFRQRKSRKTGLSTVELQKKFPELATDNVETEKTANKSGYIIVLEIL